jgi:hypothetical protein
MTKLPPWPFGGWTPWKWFFYHFPGAQGIRAISRVGVLLSIPAAIGIAYACQARIHQKKFGILVVAISFVLLEQGRSTETFDRMSIEADVQKLHHQLTAQPTCRAFFYAVSKEDLSTNWYTVHLKAMLTSLASGTPTVNGYSGNFPPGYASLMDPRFLSRPTLSDLRIALDRWMLQHQLDPSSACLLTDAEVMEKEP